MSALLASLHARNVVLYQLGWVCIAGVLICAVLVLTTQTQVMGVNAYIKPLKFLASTSILCWTMAWYMAALPQKGSIQAYSWMVVIVFAIELGIIIWQATR